MSSKISALVELLRDQVSGNEEAVLAIGGTNKKIKISTLLSLIPNPTAESLGLGYVDNTRDIDKPVSKATQQALLGKASLVHRHTIASVDKLQETLDSKSDVGHKHTVDEITGYEPQTVIFSSEKATW